MKKISFNYKDLAGNETYRTVLVLNEPNPNYTTLDVTEVNEPDISLAKEEIERAYKEYKEAESQILDSYGLLKFRSFKPERMTNMVS